MWPSACRSNRIPETGFPLLIAGSFAWFPSHTTAFKIFFVVGGLLGVVTNLMLVLCIHPRDDQVCPLLIIALARGGSHSRAHAIRARLEFTAGAD